jgi:EpsI family protein
MTEGRTAVGLWIALIGAGVVAWALQMRPALVADASTLGTTPQRIGAWVGEDDPLATGVEDVLEADYNLKRSYHGPADEPIWLYVGYYGTHRGGRPEHTPRGCYTGAGWGIAESRIVETDPDAGLRVQEYLVERDGQRRLVHYWYRSHRRTGMIGGLDQNLDRLLGRLLEGRADGALIRISTPIGSGDVVAARGRLVGFGARLDALLAERWPVERPASERGADAQVVAGRPRDV